MAEPGLAANLWPVQMAAILYFHHLQRPAAAQADLKMATE
jgi:hypothetical protein